LAHEKESQPLATHHCLTCHPQLHTPLPLHLVPFTIHILLPLHPIPILGVIHVRVSVRVGTTFSTSSSSLPCSTPTTPVPMAEATGVLAGLTAQDQKLVVAALKSLKNGLEVSLLCLLPPYRKRISYARFSCLSDLSKFQLWLAILCDDESSPKFM
jgi:hypothetical protein